MHKNPWPEIMSEHSKAGIKNYSIFQNEKQFVYVFECDDVEKAFKHLADSEDCQRWNALRSKMVEGSFDFEESEPIKFLEELFYLKCFGTK